MKRTYIAPMLTVVSFKIEQGFATSGTCTMRLFQDADMAEINNDYNASGQENWYQDGNNLFGNGW